MMGLVTIAIALQAAAPLPPPPPSYDPALIFFDRGSAQISIEGRRVAAWIAKDVRARPRQCVDVFGYADVKEGSEVAKRKLADSRAVAVRQLLISLGVRAAAIAANGRADRFPLVETSNAQNQRATIMPCER